MEENYPILQYIKPIIAKMCPACRGLLARKFIFRNVNSKITNKYRNLEKETFTSARYFSLYETFMYCFLSKNEYSRFPAMEGIVLHCLVHPLLYYSYNLLIC